MNNLKNKKSIKEGDSFGRLIVISKDIEKSGKNSYFVCKCSCGNKKSVMRSNLISGNTISCGCFRKERPSKSSQSKAKDMTGLRFGMLLVVERGENTPKGQAQWWCQCDCEEMKLVEGASLRNGNSTSCGCKRSQTIKAKPSPAINLVGHKYGKLMVLRRGPNDKKKVQWWCLCECGNTALKKGDSLKRDVVKSCGCLELANRLKNCSKRKIKHGLYKHPLYLKFQGMVARCYNIKAKGYHRYGGRGITVCDEWLESQEKFIKWALENGWKKDANLSVDRIDNDGNYCPKNCRIIGFAENTVKRFTDKEQGLVVAGVSINIREHCRTAEVSPETVKKLLRAGYSNDCIIRYGKLEHFQKIAVGKSITNNQPISIDAAMQIKKIHKTRARQPGYTNYMGMMGRCYNPNNKYYSDYGARGIIVCDRWRNNFKQFLADMGPPPHRDAAIHRINPEGNYEPVNCEWVSRSENTRAMHSKMK